jgi:TM2 domain-containing membrane protein YozV/predicted RNA-binding Zn-ribbon protein involved in translation (DUF1610 family)
MNSQSACPVCRGVNPANAQFCVRCGSLIEPAARQMQGRSWFCPQCGQANISASSFCGQCNTPFPFRPIDTRRLDPSTPRFEPIAFGQHPLPYGQAAPMMTEPKNRGVYIVLALMLGLLGVHNFYAGRNAAAIAQLLITFFTFWLVLPILAIGLWVLIEVVTVNTDGVGQRMS